jgi:cytochrome P450
MTAVTPGPLYWDPYDPNFFANPYPSFRRLREEAPIYYNDRYDFFAVSRYADVEHGLTDKEAFSSARGDILEMIKQNVPVPYGSFIHEDPPVHTVHRRVLTKVFTPKKMAALEPQIRQFCAKALDPLVAGGEFDFITHLGAQMPMRVIGMLLGIPEEDQEAVRERVDANLRTEAGKPIDYSNQHALGEGFEDYIEWRARHPSNDLMTELLNVEFEDEKGTNRKLTRDEILIFVNILAGAGNETTNRLIGWTGKLLAEHPDQRRQIHENRDLIAQTIEEVLRYEPPGPCVARYVARDAEFHGVKVPAGSTLVCLIGAANRDESKFVNGEQFDIQRPRAPHLTFGHGIHVCLGNALARIEGRIALDELLNRFPEWNVDMDNARLSSTSTVRGWETLPAYTPRASGTRNAAGNRSVAKPAPQPEAAAVSIPGAETWKIILNSPVGPQEMTAQILRNGNTFTGRIESPMGSEEMSNGVINGTTLTWTMAVKKPMSIKLTFTVEIDGDKMSGKAKLGVFGTATLTGERVR